LIWLVHADGRDAVIPGVAGLLSYSPIAEVNHILTSGATCTPEIAIVIDGNTGVAKYADGGDFVAIASQRFAALTAAKAEKRPAEPALRIEASTAPFPSSAMPVIAWWPGSIGFGIPPTALWTTLAMSAIPTAADREDGAATTLNPQALTIDSPRLALNARRPADLALESDLIGIVAAAVFAIVVVGLALDGLLSGGKCGNNKKSKSYSEEAEERRESHLASSCEMLCGRRRMDAGETFETGTVCEKSLTQGERVWLNKRCGTRECDEFANARRTARTKRILG